MLVQIGRYPPHIVGQCLKALGPREQIGEPGRKLRVDAGGFLDGAGKFGRVRGGHGDDRRVRRQFGPPRRFDALGWEGKRPFPKDGVAAADPDEDVNARNLCRRAQALKHALDNLPRYARRLALREARLKQESGAPLKGARQTYKRRTLRWGDPPGHCKKPEREVDDLLRECHRLALYARTAPDTG